MFDAQLRRDLERITGRAPSASEEPMAHVLQRLDEWAAKPGLPERLQHYLSRRSYVKALEWLDDPDTPHRV